jgi:hypothetical protein
VILLLVWLVLDFLRVFISGVFLRSIWVWGLNSSDKTRSSYNLIDLYVLRKIIYLNPGILFHFLFNLKFKSFEFKIFFFIIFSFFHFFFYLFFFIFSFFLIFIF